MIYLFKAGSLAFSRYKHINGIHHLTKPWNYRHKKFQEKYFISSLFQKPVRVPVFHWQLESSSKKKKKNESYAIFFSFFSNILKRRMNTHNNVAVFIILRISFHGEEKKIVSNHLLWIKMFIPGIQSKAPTNAIPSCPKAPALPGQCQDTFSMLQHKSNIIINNSFLNFCSNIFSDNRKRDPLSTFLL